MGYEIWDRDARTLVADFDDHDEALDFLREMVRDLDVEGTTRAIDPMQLVCVSEGGRKQEVVCEGVSLLTLIFAPALAHTRATGAPHA